MSRTLRTLMLCGLVVLIAVGVAYWTGLLEAVTARHSALMVDERQPLYHQFRQRSRRILENPQAHESVPMPAWHEDRG